MLVNQRDDPSIELSTSKLQGAIGGTKLTKVGEEKRISHSALGQKSPALQIHKDVSNIHVKVTACTASAGTPRSLRASPPSTTPRATTPALASASRGCPPQSAASQRGRQAVAGTSLVCFDRVEQKCEKVMEQQCHEQLAEECSTVEERICSTVTEQRCSSVEEQSCGRVQEQKCTSGYQQSCTTQVCSTELEPVEVPRQVCRSVPQQGCRQMPRQPCQQVQQGGECRQVKREVCQAVTSQKCQDVPQQQCLVVPVEKCVPDTSRRCGSQPRQQCRKVPNKVCQEVPRQVCKAVPKKSLKKPGYECTIQDFRPHESSDRARVPTAREFRHYGRCTPTRWAPPAPSPGAATVTAASMSDITMSNTKSSERAGLSSDSSLETMLGDRWVPECDGK